MGFRPSFAWQAPQDDDLRPSRGKIHLGRRLAQSGVEQRRGGVPQSISMVCGNVTIELKESVTQERMPRRSRSPSSCSRWTKTGPHHVAPTNFEARTRAALRNHAGARAAAEDDRRPAQPGGLHDGASVDGGTAEGTSAVWKGAPQRELIVVQPQVE